MYYNRISNPNKLKAIIDKKRLLRQKLDSCSLKNEKTVNESLFHKILKIK